MVEFTYILVSGALFTIGLLGDVITTLWSSRYPDISVTYPFQRWFIEKGLYTIGHLALLVIGLVLLYMFRNDLIMIFGIALLGLGLLVPTYNNLRAIKKSSKLDYYSKN
jgi:hypothetical protein